MYVRQACALPALLCGGVAMVMEGVVDGSVGQNQLCMLSDQGKPLAAFPPVIALHLCSFHPIRPSVRMSLPLQYTALLLTFHAIALFQWSRYFNP